MTQNVMRLVLASRYFLGFNKVDKHKQLRQSELALEKKLLTTMVGFVSSPAWLASM
jgi:hypothetical protein